MYLLPSNSTFITRSRGEFSWPRDTGGGSGLWIYAFPWNFFVSVLLQSVSKITLMSCCQKPSRGAGFKTSPSQALLEWAAPSLGTCPCSRHLCISTGIVQADCEERQDNVYIVICKNYGINCRLCGCPVSFIYILALSLMIKYFKVTNKFVS